MPWQVEAGKMAAGDGAPGQIWSSGLRLCPTFSKRLKPKPPMMQEGPYMGGEQRTPAPVALMCRAAMSDAGPRPNTQTKAGGDDTRELGGKKQDGRFPPADHSSFICSIIRFLSSKLTSEIRQVFLILEKVHLSASGRWGWDIPWLRPLSSSRGGRPREA